MQTDIQLLSPKEVCSALGISRSTLDRHVKAGSLPEPVRFGSTVRWRHNDILQVIAPEKPTPRKRTRNAAA